MEFLINYMYPTIQGKSTFPIPKFKVSWDICNSFTCYFVIRDKVQNTSIMVINYGAFHLR